MGLEIFHTRAEKTHENEQFRRVAKGLRALFNKKNWDGLLIGNPNNPDFQRFKADALLYYSHGLIIIDLKDYSGDIKLPPNDDEFIMTKWYNDIEKDKRRIEIKGGSYINPFKQLDVYRETLKELIKSNLLLSSKIHSNRICIINVFNGTINLNRETPRSFPFYKITDESNIQSFLYDFASPDTYYLEVAEVWKKVFPSELWVEKLDYKNHSEKFHQNFELIDDNFKSVLTDFLNHQERQILLLESGDTKKRDEWMQFILSDATNFNIPQTEIWTHSSRIAGRIKKRTGIEPQSLFSTIYGGNIESIAETDISEEINLADTGKNIDEIPEQTQDIIGIKADKELDKKCLIILIEAHLVTRSLFQTELLRFGSGRLLEDLFKHLKLDDNQRKLICIGDPYSLSYGKEEESALSKETISQLYQGEVLKYRDKLNKINELSINKLRRDIISSIDKRMFNNISYEWDNRTLCEVDKNQAENIFHSWFKKSREGDPVYAVLVYKNKDAYKINQWIRKNVHGKNTDFVEGDLLLVSNNFNIPDETGLSYPQRIQNGMYLQLTKQLDKYDETIAVKGHNPVSLRFIKLKVDCVSLKPQCKADIWILENFFSNSGELTIEEQIALRIFVQQRISAYIKTNKFEDSLEYKNLTGTDEYTELIKKQNDIQSAFDVGQRVKTKLEDVAIQIRKLERNARKKHKQGAFMHLLNSDPLVNAAYVQYAYAMTVHKALGSTFKEVLLNSLQGENRGATNESYFRWLYTGISCGLDSVKVINPVAIYPLMNCVFEDTNNIILRDTHVKSKTFMIFSETEIPDKITKFSNEEVPENVKYGISILILLLQPHGYVFDRIIVSPYATKVVFTTPMGKELEEKDKLIIIMNFNARVEVTSVRIEKEGKSKRKTIEDCIIKLYELSITKKTTTELPKDWRGETYERWIQKSKQYGYVLTLMEEHNSQSVFKIINDIKSAKFRVWYSNDGFFSKLIVFEKSSSEIGNEIKEILLSGN